MKNKPAGPIKRNTTIKRENRVLIKLKAEFKKGREMRNLWDKTPLVYRRGQEN